MHASFVGQRVTVMGLGRFGGGVGVTRFLASRGARVLVTDLDPADKLQKSVLQLADLPAGVDYRLGEHRVEDFTGADLVVVNPAVRPDNVYVQAARDAGVPITSEIRLLVEHLPNRMRTIGVTGTAGKSTTTAMVGHILSRVTDRRVRVGGNIGGSLLAQLDSITLDDWIVLELSSFMLESLREARWSPHIAVITNVMPNHLDWHPTFEHYLAAKQVIFDYQSDEDFAIIPQWQSHLLQLDESRWPDRVMAFDNTPEDYLRDELLVPGLHNRMNAVMACGAAKFAGVPWRESAAALADFAGLPHRLQFVCERNGVRYFNDSKSTTPEAAILAIESFPSGGVHAILGGYDKHADLTAMARTAARRCRAIYTIGTTGDAIASAAGGLASSGTEVTRCHTLDRAVQETVTRVRQGDVVLLSPGCASWDQFDNFEQRGAAFVEAVLKYQGEGSPPAGS